MPDFSLEELIELPGVHLIQKGLSQNFSGLHFDSRKIRPGDGFLARTGQSQDGHKFIDSAIQSGATLVILQNPQKILDSVTVIKHHEPFEVLQNLAQNVRKKSPRLVIGVTGSVGKTSTKECLRALLGNNAFASSGNYNNLTGLPISILQCPSGSGYLVLEMGISEVGEMGSLASIACPDLMVITGVFSSHLAQFESYEDLVKEKLSCLKYLNPEGHVFLPENLLPALKRYWPQVKFVLLKNDSDSDSEFSEKLGQGPYLSYEIAAQVARFLGVSDSEILLRRNEISLAPLRMQRVHSSGIQWILDCYNSSPQSVKAFLESIKNEEPGLMVLADMKELGQDSDLSHISVLNQLEHLNGWEVLFLGDCFHKALHGYSSRSSWHKVGNKEEVLRWISEKKPTKIALKGSRFYALETLCCTN
ncbi:MAG: hypothetical protein H3C47_07930 [Candidatus Cloacimonetes bacterium]|nr:hypothetical protein [Candidatus Cloacimonadota bacterium]